MRSIGYKWVVTGCCWLLLVVAAVASFLTQCAFQGELRLERTKMTNLEMQLEEKRRSMEQVQEALERKREKKKKWKAAQRECGDLLQCGGNMEWGQEPLMETLSFLLLIPTPLYCR